MKKIDFIIQLIMFVFAACFVLAGIVHLSFFILLAYLQFFVGSWQLISAVVTTATANRLEKQHQHALRKYWILVVIYFVGFVALIGINKIHNIVFVLWFFSAWAIAVYYFLITKKLAQQHKHKTFLEILN